MSSQGMDSTLRMILGSVFLVAMLVLVILALTTFEGTPTILLVVFGIIFLAVALVFFFGGESDGSAAVAAAAARPSSQQQSVVLSGGRVITQSGGDIDAVCTSCNTRVPDNASFCPNCGNKMAG